MNCLLKGVLLQIDRLVDEAAGFVIDLSSTKSIRKALFETLKIPVPNSKTTRTGKPRTDAEVGSCFHNTPDSSCTEARFLFQKPHLLVRIRGAKSLKFNAQSNHILRIRCMCACKSSSIERLSCQALWIRSNKRQNKPEIGRAHV